jgi:pimeloyl-ACP methyl ester carboxylesterase
LRDSLSRQGERAGPCCDHIGEFPAQQRYVFRLGVGTRQWADKSAWFRNLFYWIFSTRFFNDAAFVDAAIQYALAYPYPQSATAFQNQIGAIAAFDSTEALANIRTKTLVLGGGGDLLFPLDECRKFARSLPHAEFVAIENAGHSIHLENPQAFVKHVIDFLPQR